jgi:hypothetical protein
MGRLTQKPIEIGHDTSNECLSARIGSGRRFGEKREQVARLLYGLRPSGCRSGCQELLQGLTTLAERCLVCLDLDSHAAQLGGDAGSHAAVLIEIRWLINHSLHLAPATARREWRKPPEKPGKSEIWPGASIPVIRSRQDYEVDECQNGDDQSHIQDRQLVMLPEMVKALQDGHLSFDGDG